MKNLSLNLLNIQLSFKTLIDSIKNFVAQLIGAIVAASVLSALMSTINPFGAAKGSNSVFNILKQMGGLGSMIGNMAGNRANGGEVNFGSAYMVGERGREMFIPSQSGTIISNDALMGMGNKGGTGEVVFKISKDNLVGILKKDEKFKQRF